MHTTGIITIYKPVIVLPIASASVVMHVGMSSSSFFISVYRNEYESIRQGKTRELMTTNRILVKMCTVVQTNRKHELPHMYGWTH